MGWLDNLRRRGEQARAVTPVAAVTQVQPDREEQLRPIAPAIPRSKPKLERVIIQTSSPRRDHQGSVELGWYTVQDGVLTMRDEGGKATGPTHVLREGDNPAAIAQVIRREQWRKTMGEGDFNRPLRYGPTGLA